MAENLLGGLAQGIQSGVQLGYLRQDQQMKLKLAEQNAQLMEMKKQEMETNKLDGELKTFWDAVGNTKDDAVKVNLMNTIGRPLLEKKFGKTGTPEMTEWIQGMDAYTNLIRDAYKQFAKDGDRKKLEANINYAYSQLGSLEARKQAAEIDKLQSQSDYNFNRSVNIGGGGSNVVTPNRVLGEALQAQIQGKKLTPTQQQMVDQYLSDPIRKQALTLYKGDLANTGNSPEELADKLTAYQNLLSSNTSQNKNFDVQSGTPSSAQSTGGRIRVKNKQTGQIGSIPESNFDAMIYDKI